MKDLVIGTTYEDPEGIWEVTEINGNLITVLQVQDENINFGKEFIVTREEVEYYLND